MLLIRRPPALNTRTVVYSALLGLLNPLAYYWVLFTAYSLLPAQAAQPLNYTWPLFLALLAAPVAGKKTTWREMAGLLVSLGGVIVISLRPGGGEEPLNLLGICLALGSGIIWSFYWLAGARIQADGTLRLFWGFSSALVVLGALWLFRGASVPATPSGWFTTAWVGLFEMGITFLLWNGAMVRTQRPGRLGNLVYLGPFISLIWIALVLGETIRPATVIGLAVIVLGILVSRSR